MVEINTLIFCNRQYYFMMIMSKLHIAKLINHESCYDPITGKEMCKHVLISVPRLINRLYTVILNGLNDSDGRNKLERLINLGAISQNNN